RRPQQAPDVCGLRVDDRERREERADRERDHDPEEHRDAAEPRCGTGVHVARPDLRVEPEPRRGIPDDEREGEGGRPGDAGGDAIEDLARRSSPATRTAAPPGITPWLTLRSLPSGCSRFVASTIVDPVCAAASG